MKATVKIYTTDSKGKEGYPVKLILSHNRKVRRKTLAHTLKEQWDDFNQLPTPYHPDYEELYDTINDIRKQSQKAAFKRIDDFDTAFEYLITDKKTHSNDFYKYMQERIDYMRKVGRTGNANVYEETKKELEKFSPSLRFEQITTNFLQEFKEYKLSDNVKNVTIRKYLAETRAIYNSAVRKGITEDKRPFAGVFSDLPIKKRRARNRYLTKEQIRFLEGLNLDRSYQRAIDLSLLQFYLCGADLIDIYYIKKENIVGNRVFLTRKKLGGKSYEFDVYLPEKAKAIIEKYQEEGEYVFPWRKSYDGYVTFRNNHNRNLKIIQKRLKLELHPKNDNLTTKVMRHSFATLGKFERIEEDLLRELMGHERNDIDTVYKDKYPEKERDAAQLKIVK